MSKPRKKQPPMAKHWCFTDFSRLEVKDWEAKSLTALFCDKIEYLVVGMEICPTTGRPHGQGYLKLIKGARFTGVKKTLLLPGVALFITKGTPIQAINYCIYAEPKDACLLKDAKDIFEYGERPKGQGGRSDLDEGVKILQEGGNISDLAQQCPKLIVKYPSGFVKLAALLMEVKTPIERPVEVFWLWGETRTGKTHSAMYAKEEPFVLHGYQLKKQYFCSYKGQKTLIIDEFAHQCPITFLMSICDKWKCEVDVKYGSTFAQWETVFITTNKTYPEAIYPGADERHRAALFARTTKALHFSKPWREATPIMWDTINDQSYGDVTEPDSPVSMPQNQPSTITESRFIFDLSTE